MLADSIIEIIVELIRGLFLEGLVDRVRRLRPRRKLRGIRDVHRHVHLANRERLLNRLFTERRPG